MFSVSREGGWEFHPFLRAALGKDLQCRPVCIFQLFLEPFSQLEPEVEMRFAAIFLFWTYCISQGMVRVCPFANLLIGPWLEFERHFYTQTLLHTDTFTHRHSHTHAFTHRRFYTQKRSHTDVFTHRSVYTQTFLHTKAFAHRLLSHRRFHIQKLLHTDAFTRRRLYTQALFTTKKEPFFGPQNGTKSRRAKKGLNSSS